MNDFPNDLRYARYEALKLRRHEHGILEVIMSGKGVNKSALAAADERMHCELADIWRDIDTDPHTRVAIIRGEGKGFSCGGDVALVEQIANDFQVRARIWREARDLVYNLINCSKPVVSSASAGRTCTKAFVRCVSAACHGLRTVRRSDRAMSIMAG